MRTLKVCSLGNFQVYNTVLLTLVAPNFLAFNGLFMHSRGTPRVLTVRPILPLKGRRRACAAPLPYCLPTAQLPDHLISKTRIRPHLGLLPGNSLPLLTPGCVRAPPRASTAPELPFVPLLSTPVCHCQSLCPHLSPPQTVTSFWTEARLTHLRVPRSSPRPRVELARGTLSAASGGIG